MIICKKHLKRILPFIILVILFVGYFGMPTYYAYKLKYEWKNGNLEYVKRLMEPMAIPTPKIAYKSHVLGIKISDDNEQVIYITRKSLDDGSVIEIINSNLRPKNLELLPISIDDILNHHRRLISYGDLYDKAIKIGPYARYLYVISASNCLLLYPQDNG